jgi:integrase/recombinase XerC
MPHFPKPFFRPRKNRWYVQLDGKQVNLGPDEKEAFRRYHEVMAARKQPVPVTPPSDDPLLIEILDAFLDWCLKHREKRTFESYEERIKSFLDSLADRRMPLKGLRPFHLQQWVDGHPDWNPGMKRGRMQAVQRALNWAVKQGRIDKSPVAFVEKPPPGKREVVIDYPTYQRMRELTWTQEFRDLIDVSWETGCRPQEIWRVEKRHLDVAGKRWVFPARESKGKRKIRIVYLTDLAVEVCQRLAAKHPTGPLFRNSDGVPWSRHAASCVFLRMKKHLGKKYALVDYRHSFTTRSLKAGVDPVTLSFLLGHADTSMLAKTYAHLDQEVGHLRGALAKINPVTPPGASA